MTQPAQSKTAEQSKQSNSNNGNINIDAQLQQMQIPAPVLKSLKNDQNVPKPKNEAPHSAAAAPLTKGKHLGSCVIRNI